MASHGLDRCDPELEPVESELDVLRLAPVRSSERLLEAELIVEVVPAPDPLRKIVVTAALGWSILSRLSRVATGAPTNAERMVHAVSAKARSVRDRSVMDVSLLMGNGRRYSCPDTD